MEKDKECRNIITSIPEPNPNCIEVDDTAFSVETVHKLLSKSWYYRASGFIRRENYSFVLLRRWVHTHYCTKAYITELVVSCVGINYSFVVLRRWVHTHYCTKADITELVVSCVGINYSFVVLRRWVHTHSCTRADITELGVSCVGKTTALLYCVGEYIHILVHELIFPS